MHTSTLFVAPIVLHTMQWAASNTFELCSTRDTRDTCHACPIAHATRFMYVCTNVCMHNAIAKLSRRRIADVPRRRSPPFRKFRLLTSTLLMNFLTITGCHCDCEFMRETFCTCTKFMGFNHTVISPRLFQRKFSFITFSIVVAF